MTECRIAAMDDMHPDWPNDGMGIGGGALFQFSRTTYLLNGPRPEQDVAFLQNRLKLGNRATESFQAEMTPWWHRPSTATYANNVYALGMGTTS